MAHTDAPFKAFNPLVRLHMLFDKCQKPDCMRRCFLERKRRTWRPTWSPPQGNTP